MNNLKLEKLRKRILSKRIFLMLILYILIQAIFYLNGKSYINIPLYILDFISTFLFSIVTILVISIIIRLTSSKVFKFFEQELEIEQRIFISKLYSFFLYMLSLGIILWKAGVSLNSITLFLGLVATGIAFAVRDVLVSIFAWFIVLSKKPFKIHDQVKIGEDSGKVFRIGTFYLTLKPSNNSEKFLKIPNKILLEKPIENYGKGRKQYTVKIGLNNLPDDLNEKIKHLHSQLAEYTHEKKDNIIIKVDNDGINWHLSVSLISKADDHSIHNKIILTTFNFFKDSVRTTNNVTNQLE